MDILSRLKAFFMPRPKHPALAPLETLLSAAIPKVVAKAKVEEPVYCMRIWYNGTDSDEDAVPYLMLVKESTRKQMLAQHGKKAPYYIWCADELTSPGQAVEIYIPHKQIQKVYRVWYAHLCEVDEQEAELQLFREMIQRVALKLNSLNWQELAPVTDDFVVFPADGSHNFMDDFGDLSASVTPERLRLLRARNLIGKKKWDEL
jgi:hypothetical protein